MVVKASVWAMDAVAKWVATKPDLSGKGYAASCFSVVGASKRGWET